MFVFRSFVKMCFKMRNILTCIIFLLISISAFGEDPPCPFPPCEIYPELPIDSGLSFLLIAGAAYGIYESRKKKK